MENFLMSTKENVQLVKDFFSAIGAYNKQDLLGLVAADIGDSHSTGHQRPVH
jgi:hypothetical protein